MHLAIHNLTASQLRDNFTILTTEPIVIFVLEKLQIIISALSLDLVILVILLI